MDRDRLKEVHATDLTESRINEEFVEWLRTKGWSWLLVILLGVAGYMGILRWKQYKSNYLSQAWIALAECQLPGAFEDVAAKYSDVPGLPQVARRQAAETLLRSVQSGRPLGSNFLSSTPQASLTGDERLEYLGRADRLYQEVLDADDGSLATTLHAVSALQGRAVVAECRGDVAEATRLYEVAATRAETTYPWLAERARQRASTVDVYAAAISLPKQADLPTKPPAETLEPATIDEALRDLLLPDDSGDGDA